MERWMVQKEGWMLRQRWIKGFGGRGTRPVNDFVERRKKRKWGEERE